MNFFEEQDQAKRVTNKLVILFVLAVCSLIFITVTAIHSLYFFTNPPSKGFIEGLFGRIFSLQMIYITLSILFVVGMGSLFKFFEVNKGGSYVAERLGGQPLTHDSADIQQKVLLNVVEEMAIASGITVPKVFVLPELSLNAFAAGTNNNNAIIAVTQGLLDTLNRDELQGVIAHEFSHIFHGDMSINMKLLSVLHGILMIGLLGEYILRSSFYGRSNRRKDGNKVVILGAALLVLGYAGVFFGNLIKAGISRQREYLADASAVQYTRNPQGISAALYKINKQGQSSALEASAAKEFSHFYFCPGATSFFSGMFATHPAIKDRIAKIYPNGYSEELLIGKKQTYAKLNPQTQPQKSKTQDVFELDPQDSIIALSTLGVAIEKIGKIDQDHINQASTIINSLPEILLNACRHPFESQALIFAMLTDSHEGVQKKQQQYLAPKISTALFTTYETLLTHIQSITNLNKLTLLQLATSSLKQQSNAQFDTFIHHCKHLIQADQQVNIFEWCVFQIIGAVHKHIVTKHKLSLHECEQAVKDLFFAIIQDTGLSHQQQAATAGYQLIYPRSEIILTENKASALPFLQSSISRIKQLKSLEQPVLLKGLAKAIEYDGKLDENEAQIFRALAIILDCPMPILMDDKPS